MDFNKKNKKLLEWLLIKGFLFLAFITHLIRVCGKCS